MDRIRLLVQPNPMKLSLAILFLWMGLLLASPAEGGPHAGGVIVLHWNEALVYTEETSYCGQSGLELCDVAVTRADLPDEVVVLHVLAAFPGDGFPRLAGVTFGVQYDEAQIEILDWGPCGDFELPDGNWPDSGRGNAVTWSEAQTDHLTEIYWFAAHSLFGNPQLALMDHPTGGGYFADDDVPSNIDPIADYGTFGFNSDGYLPCPVPPPTTATLELVPAEITVYQPCGGSFGVDLQVNEVYSLAAFEACVGYDPTFLEFDEAIIDPGFLGSTGRDVFPVEPVSCTPTCESSGARFGAYTTGSEDAPSGSGRLATLRFSPQGAGSATNGLCLDNWELTNDRIPPGIINLTDAFGLTITHRPFCYGDFTGDGDVTVFDIAQILPKWGCCVGEGCYSPTRDVNLLERGAYCASVADGCIDVLDIQSVAGRWHRGCPGTAPAAVSAVPTVRISPEQANVAAYIGDTTSVAVVVEDVLDLGAFEAALAFDPAVVQVETVQIGGFPGSTGRTLYNFTPQIDNVAGTIRFGACSVGGTAGPDGSGILARVVFVIEACDAMTDLDLTEVTVTATDGWPHELETVIGGSLEIVCAADVPTETASTEYMLFPPRPNPLSRATVFTFSLPATAGDGERVQLDIFSAAGRHIQGLLDQDLGPGKHSVVWDARNESGERLPGGTYFCRLTFDGKVLKRPIQLVK